MPAPFGQPAMTVHQRWALAVATGAILLLTYFLRIVLLPFVIAAAIAFVVSPLVHWLALRLHLPRWSAGLVIYALLLGMLAGAGFWMARVLEPEAKQLSRNAPGLVRETFRRFAGGDEVVICGNHLTPDQIIKSGQSAAARFVGDPAQAIATAVGAIMGGFLCLLLLLFFLISGPQLSRGVLLLVPPPLRPGAGALAAELRPVLFRYIVGVFVVVLLAATMAWIALSVVLGLPHALLVALAVGVLETIPVIGPATSALLLGIVAISSGTVSVVIGVAAFALAMRLVIDQLIGPLVLGRAVKLHPVVILFAMLAGGVLFGVLGVLLAVPGAASARVALRRLYAEAPGFAAGEA